MSEKPYKIIVMGVSAGGCHALMRFFSLLPEDFSTPIVIAQHLHPTQSYDYVEIFKPYTHLGVSEAKDDEAILPGHIYFAPANYHLLIEDTGCFSLSVDEKVNFSRPSVDILFESAADTYGESAIGVILTGANNDGAAGLCYLAEHGGVAIVQSPDDAEFEVMPCSAIEVCQVDYILPLDCIAEFLGTLC